VDNFCIVRPRRSGQFTESDTDANTNTNANTDTDTNANSYSQPGPYSNNQHRGVAWRYY
jgi:hypothetical protein